MLHNPEDGADSKSSGFTGEVASDTAPAPEWALEVVARILSEDSRVPTMWGSVAGEPPGTVAPSAPPKEGQWEVGSDRRSPEGASPGMTSTRKLMDYEMLE